MRVASPAILTTILAALITASPAGAEPPPPIPPAETLLPAPPGPPTRGPSLLPGPGPLSIDLVRDRLLDQPAARAASGIRPAAAALFPTGDGQMVTVRWSGAYDASDAQQVVDFLSGLLHGPELESLGVFLATPAEIDQICGDDALACYSPFEEEMVISGDPGPESGLSREFVVAHEYGHHVANNRDARPFPALRFGPRFWATQQRVCPGTAAGRYDPYKGYFNNPGEAWAESFAFLHYPNETPWLWTLPHPSPASYAAIRRDVLHPWRHGDSGRVRGRVGGQDVTDAYVVHTPLDGRLVLKLKARGDADLDLYLSPRSRFAVLAAAAGPRRNERIRYLICGKASFRVLVVADRGRSGYTLKATRP